MRTIVALLFVIVSAAISTAADPTVGGRVFVKQSAEAKIGRVTVDPKTIPFPATVSEENGDWLWLEKGWVRKGDVMFAEAAMEYYSEQIRSEPTKADGWYYRGEVWREKGDYDNAISDQTEAIRLDPKHSAAYAKRGMSWRTKADIESALKDFTASLDLSSTNSDVCNNRGELWLEKGELANAIQDFSKAIESDPDHAIAYNNRGRAYYKQGDDDKALFDFDHAIRLDPMNFLAYNNRGFLLSRKGDGNAALRDFTEAIHLHSDFGEAYYNRAVVLQSLGRLDFAATDYSFAIRFHPQRGSGGHRHEAFWGEKGELVEAVKGLTELIRKSDKDHGAFNNIAWLQASCPDDRFRNGIDAIQFAMKACELTSWGNWNYIDTLAAAYSEAGDFANAIKWQEKALESAVLKDRPAAIERLELYRQNSPFRERPKEERNPFADENRGDDWKAAVVFFDRGEVASKKGRLDNAIAEYSAGIRLDPTSAIAFNDRGEAFRKNGEFDNAIKDFTEAIRLDPKFTWPHNNRGLCWANKREFENALKDYAEAIRLDPKYAFPFNNRGLVRAEKKEFDLAIQDYTEAIRLDPKYALPFVNRGNVWNEKGEFSKAIEDYANAIQLNPALAQAFNAIAWLKATCPDERFRSGKEAVEYATRACELTDWKSFAELDTLAASYAEAGDFTKAIIWGQTSLEKATEVEKSAANERLGLYQANQPYHQPKTDKD